MDAVSAQRYARIAGILVLLSIVAGGFGESYVPGRLLAANNVAETARNLAGSPLLFRLSFAAYLVEAICDVTLALLFYALLRPVSRYVSLLAAFFSLVSTAVFAVAELFYYVASLPVLDTNVTIALPSEARDIFIFTALTLFATGFSIFSAFYGIATALRGYLIFRSGYFPRSLGLIVMLAGAGFILRNFVVVLAPQLNSALYLLPMFLAMFCLTFWLLFKGVRRDRWEEAVSSVARTTP